MCPKKDGALPVNPEVLVPPQWVERGVEEKRRKVLVPMRGCQGAVAAPETGSRSSGSCGRGGGRAP